jgi:hypothetical protein
VVNKSALTYISYAVLLASNVALADCNVKSNVKTESRLDNVNFKQDIQYEFITVDKRQACQATLTLDVRGNPFVISETAVMEPGVDILDSCKLAEAKAIEQTVKQLGQVDVTAESEVDCDEKTTKLYSPAVGEVGQLSQFKRDRKYSGTFQYQGTECIWFNDVEWKGELHRANGIACHVKDDNYVVVDKF